MNVLNRTNVGFEMQHVMVPDPLYLALLGLKPRSSVINIKVHFAFDVNVRVILIIWMFSAAA